ncbi:MAG: HAMP domain-containing protein, partial [Anaerolineae bacterium]|nr:HAMP domain-containing protein [Anaerolineae bacterium]
MNKFKNIKIRNKLIISFVLISLVSGLTIYWGYQLALQRISDDALPTLQTIGQTTQLISDTQREAMEYFADDEEPEQLDDHIESLTITVNGLRKLSDDEDEVEPFNELANLASESADMSLRLVASHKNTKNNIESLGENLADNESLFQEISNRVDVEVEESIESGALDELIEDALPTKDSVNRLEDDIHLMELSVQSYLLTGDAEAARAYEDAKARAEATLTELEGTLEEDEANEGELLAALVVLLQETDTIGRATLDSHENTLALLEEMENLELRLNPIREVVTDYATRDVNEALASAQANVLIASAVALLFSFVLALFLSRAIASPIVRLTAVAQEISQGNLTVTAREESKDETGTLAHTFNNMTRQLRDLVENLEQRITDRTQDLNLAADIGRQVSQARELKDVLNEAVISMKDQFNLYQVQIYLADAKRENLILRASDGFAGSRLLETGHTLPINEQSLNGSAAYKKQAVIVSNTQESANFRPHPLLPDTRSEMVVPLLVEDDVLGVIDLQSTKANSLTEDVLPAFSVLAGQLAIAIMNARQNRTMQENQ